MPKLSSKPPAGNMLSAQRRMPVTAAGRLFQRLEFVFWLAPALGNWSAFYLSSHPNEIGLSLFAADGFSAPRFVGFQIMHRRPGTRLLGALLKQRLVRRRNSLRQLIFALIAHCSEWSVPR